MRVRTDLSGQRAGLLDLHQILDNPYVEDRKHAMYNPEDEFDFKLENTLDMKVLLEKICTQFENRRKKRDQSQSFKHRSNPWHHPWK